jgi:hypothetical protein
MLSEWITTNLEEIRKPRSELRECVGVRADSLLGHWPTRERVDALDGSE